MIEQVVFGLIDKNGMTTTLEVKEKLRELYPNKRFYQSDISADMAEMAENGLLVYSVNRDSHGEYRVYTTPKSEVRATKTEMAEALERYEDSDVCVTITFDTAKGTRRTMTALVGPMNALGNRVMYENGNIKTICPKRLLEVEAGGIKYYFSRK